MKKNVRLRPLHPKSDFRPLVQLRKETEAHDLFGTDTSDANLHAQLKLPGHDPSQDRWIIENLQNDQLIGHGWTFNQSPLRAILDVEIHPSWRRQGLGSRLLSVMIKRSKEKGVSQINAGAGANNPTAHPFLLARNFVPVGHNRFFVANTASEPVTGIGWISQ